MNSFNASLWMPNFDQFLKMSLPTWFISWLSISKLLKLKLKHGVTIPKNLYFYHYCTLIDLLIHGNTEALLKNPIVQISFYKDRIYIVWFLRGLLRMSTIQDRYWMKFVHQIHLSNYEYHLIKCSSAIVNIDVYNYESNIFRFRPFRLLIWN